MRSLATKESKTSKPDFRAILQAELASRCQANPNYSLRSFARALKIEPSALSQMLNAKRPITEKMKYRLGSALGLSTIELEKLPTDRRAEKFSEDFSTAQISHDTFAVISDWYHYAILELTYLDGFESNVLWISRRLGITKSEANFAVERLLRLNLLKKTDEGKWVDASEAGKLTHLVPSVSSAAARKYQAELLEISRRAIQEIDIKIRNHTSATLCFDPSDMKEAVESITAFRREFAQRFQPESKAKEVYQLQISFFPLTKTDERGSKNE